MKSKQIITVIIVIAAIVALFYYMAPVEQPKFSDHKNTRYIIAGEQVLLVDGKAETEAAPGSASKITTQYFGNDLNIDLNADGREDVVFFLTQQTGGSGVFYYVAAAINTEEGYMGTEAVLIGDRIAPQSIDNGGGNIILVNYAERKPGEPFTAAPSVGKTLKLKFNAGTMQFGEVANNFEGEVDSARMSLAMGKWIWVSAKLPDGKEILPRKAGTFAVTFYDDSKSFTVKTDCNSVGGNYSAGTSTITFSKILSTEMFCGGSQENELRPLLAYVDGAKFTYSFDIKGQLVIIGKDAKGNKGSAVFRLE